MRNYLPDNIRYLRNSKRMKQEDLGKVLGKKPSTIANYESGYRTPYAEDLRAIANYFHVSVDRLLNEDLAVVTDLEAKLQADIISAEVERAMFTDAEFDMVMNYIRFVLSQRSK